jgi:L-fucose mutarotase/ribose pyranase (RbsD/FucU family)
MLKNLTRLHTPELLHTLASMGHGDDLAIVDAHFLAVSMAQRPGGGKHVPFAKIERRAFDKRAKKARAIVALGELRPYGCILIKKGVVPSR